MNALTRERAVAYAWIAAVCLGVAGDAIVIAAQYFGDVAGRPGNFAFLNFWAAGSLALEGDAAAAYDWARHAAAAKALFPGAPPPETGWLYPPFMLLVFAPLALLPYFAARATWTLGTLGAYLASIRGVSRHLGALLLAVAFTAVFQNLWWNQTGFLSAALLGGGALLLDRRPWLAGALLGATAFKPQLAVLVPIALAAGGCWRAFLSAGASVFVLAGAAAVVFGIDAWRAFIQSLAATQDHVLLQIGPAYIPSVFGAARLLGTAVDIAWFIQALSNLGAAGLVAWAWHRPGPTLLKGALLAAAVPLASPYVHPYDLMLLAFPIACVIREGRREGFLPGEHAVLLAAFVLPGIVIVADLRGLPLMPPITAALAWIVLRRLRRAAGAVPPG